MKQGEIWFVNLDPTVGAEIKKTRRAIIISVDDLGKLPLKIIAPITDWKEHFADYPWMVKIIPSEENCLSKISAIDCFQVKSVSTERFTGKIGSVDSEIIMKVQEAVSLVIGSI